MAKRDAKEMVLCGSYSPYLDVFDMADSQGFVFLNVHCPLYQIGDTFYGDVDFRNFREVNVITGAMKNSNCKKKNPLVVCRHKIIREAK